MEENNPKPVNKVGRPLIVESADQMTELIDKYFQKCADARERPTVTGLAIHLGYSSKQSIYDNIEKEEFSYPLQRATLFIENELEKRLENNSVAGVIFALKNMGWRDKTEVENSGGFNVQVTGMQIL